MSALQITNLGKSYKNYSGEWKRFAKWLGFSPQASEEHWILQDINFTLFPGEAVGIIGQNGAGKSTLLKIIAGILRATEGQILINGRIAAILELGMGFNQELTGRQNAYHALSLMGFNSSEIKQLMYSVESFAEIGHYFNKPIRTYSSGMQVRLAFSVVTAHRPEILIIDEALSVGDAYFQYKSFDRIRALQQAGTTLLMVSHDRNVIQRICHRAILLNNGRMIKDCNPEEAFNVYNALLAEKEYTRIGEKLLPHGQKQISSGTGEAKIKSITLYSDKNEVIDCARVGDLISLRIKVAVYKAIDTLVLGYSIRDRLGQVMYGTNSWHTQQIIHNPQPGDEFDFIIKFHANLGIGNYSIQVALTDQDTHLTANYEWIDLALLFKVINVNKTYFDGCLWSEPQITILSSS